MAPRQVIPYDEGGGRTSRQLLFETQQQQRQRHQQQWADPAAVENELPSCFAPPGIGRREDFEHQEQPHSSDLRDALGDEDDEDDDGGESVELGAPTSWVSRDLVPKPPGVEIFVGGLTRSTRRDMLRDWFQHAGEVTEVRIARDKRRRRCRGYGYVRFATSEEANRAIDTMHRFEFKHGRFLGVLPSDENRTLFVGGLREEWSCAYICQLLQEKMPGLRKVEPIPDREDPFKIRTFCFLEFASHAEAAAIFNRHQTSPRPALQRASSVPPQQAPPPPPDPGATSLELQASPPSRVSGAGVDGVDVFLERDNRDGSTSTGDTSGGEFFASGARAPAPSSPDHDGGDSAGGLLHFEASGLSSVWGQRRLGAEVEDRVACGAGGGGLRLSEDGFPSWSDAPAAAHTATATATATAATPEESGYLSAAGGGGGTGGGNDDGVGANTARGVPLVVGGATLKVDWADPLRYHIHLNGGIKGPSAPPEFGMLDGRPSSRGGGGGGGGSGGCGRNVSGNGGCGRPGSGDGGGGRVARCGGAFGVGRSWQQQQQQQQQHHQHHQHQHQQEQHQGLTRHPSGPPPQQPPSLSSRWQDVEHAVHAVQHQHQLHRLHQQRHQQHQQRQCMDTCTACSRGASPVTTRDRGYTIADVTTGPRGAPFGDEGGDRQRAASSSSSSGGMPPPSRHRHRHRHRPDEYHQHQHASLHHHHGLLEFTAPRLEVAADREDSGDDGRCLAMPSSWESSEGRFPPPPPHREAAVAGPASSFRPHQQHPLGASGGVSGGGGVGRGGVGGAGGVMFERRHSSHHQHHHEAGTAGTAPAGGGPYSASPDCRRDRLGALSVGSLGSGGGGGGYKGDGRAGGDVSFGMRRSVSCRPLTGERRQQQQQPHGTGPLPSSLPSWDRHASLEEAAVGSRISPNGAVGWSGGGRGAAAAAATAAVGVAAPHSTETVERCRSLSWVSGTAPAFDGHRPLQQQQQQTQQQRWEHKDNIVHDRAAEGLATKDHSWTFGNVSSSGSGGSGLSTNSSRDAAGFAMGHRDLIAQQQLQQHQLRQEHRFSSAFAASAASAALHPDGRRHSSLSDGLLAIDPTTLDTGRGGSRGSGADVLRFRDGAARSHSVTSDNVNALPPGLCAAASARAYGGGGEHAGDGWADASLMGLRSNSQHDRRRRQQQQQQQQQEGERRGRSVDVVDPVSDLHIDAAGLWESVASGAAGGSGRSNRQSSWPNALLPPDSGGASQPAPWGS